MSTNQFVKNTDKPDDDSFLWQLGNNWKISQKTGDVYASINTIEDEVLGTKLTEISETGKIDVIEYQSYFFVPNKFTDQKSGKVTWSVFAFENIVKASKKLEEIKKFAGYQPKTTVPNTPITTVAAGQKTFTAPPVTASTSGSTQSTVYARGPIPEKPLEDTLTTYTDPKEVDSSNQEYIATLQTDGYSFLPKSLVSETSWTETIYDEEGKEVGNRRIYLMGRIINVKIANK